MLFAFFLPSPGINEETIKNMQNLFEKEYRDIYIYIAWIKKKTNKQNKNQALNKVVLI